MSTHKWKRILSTVIIAALFPWSASSETLLLPSKLEVISAQAFEGDMSLDEVCENLYRVEQAEEPWGTFVVGDVATQYWFVLEHGELRSRPVTTEPLDVLPAPENVQAEITEDGYIQLTWDPVENATGYRIYYSEEEEWIPETEWFGFEGGPGNSDVWIDWGQSLHGGRPKPRVQELTRISPRKILLL